MRMGGNTTKAVENYLNGQPADWFNAWELNLSACTNCGRCKDGSVCSVADDMQKIFDALNNTDKVILASPVYFGLPTGFILNVLSRFQWAFTDYNKLPKVGKEKQGVIILTQGGDKDSADAEKIMKWLAKVLNAKVAQQIKLDNLDKE